MLPGSNVTSAGNPWRGRGLDRAAPFFGLAAILMVRTLGRSCCSALPGELSPTPSAPLAGVSERWCGLAWSKLRLEVDPAAREAVEEIPEEEAQEKLEAGVEERETAEAEEAWAVASRRGGRPRRRSRRQRHPTSTRDETAARGTPIATARPEGPSWPNALIAPERSDGTEGGASGGGSGGDDGRGGEGGESGGGNGEGERGGGG